MQTNAKERIEKIADYYNLSVKALSEKIGLDRPQALYDILKGKTKSVSYNMAERINSVFPEINRIWLLTGEGEMLSTFIMNVPELQPQTSLYTVPLLPVSAQGGSLSEFSQSVSAGEICERIVSPIRSGDFALAVNGDSMSPEYPSGSYVIVQRINERAFIEWGKVFVLDTVNGAVIKKIMPGSKTDRVLCLSINPAFTPFEVEYQYITAFYKVVVCLSLK